MRQAFERKKYLLGRRWQSNEELQLGFFLFCIRPFLFGDGMGFLSWDLIGAGVDYNLNQELYN